MTELAWYFCGGVAVLIALLALGSSLTGRSYRFGSGQVQGVIGRMGSGKSLFVVARVILPVSKALASKRGLHCSHTYRPVKRIITNFEMELPYECEVIVLDGNRLWDHLVELVGEYGTRLDALVVIDEAHLYLPSGKINMARKAAWVCSMARKLNAEIWWISQSEMKIHKRLRDDTQLIWKVGRSTSLWTIIAGPSRWFTARAYMPETLNRATPKLEDQRRYRMTKKALAAYNSFELIVPDAEADVSSDSLGRKREEAPAWTPALPPPSLDPVDDGVTADAN